MTVLKSKVLSETEIKNKDRKHCHKCGKVLAEAMLKEGSKLTIKCPRCKTFNAFNA